MTPETVLICPVMGLLVLVLALRAVGADQRRIVTAAFFAHVVGTFAVVFYHEVIFGGGDMVWFAYMGRKLALLMRADFGHWAPEVARLALHRETIIPLDGTFEGSSTGTTSALAGILMYLTGDSLTGGCLLVGFFAFYGSLALYRAVEPYLSAPEREPVIIGALLIPSFVFWSSGILKEAFVVGALGMMCHGAVSLLRRRYVAVFGFAASAVFIGLLKPYVLFAAALAFGAAFVVAQGKKISLPYKIGALVAVAAAIFFMSNLFPDFAADKLGESVARMQSNYRTTTGGSNIEMGDDDIDVVDKSLVPQLKYVPLALANALFRPFLFEARSPVQLVAALEMTAMIVIAFGLLRRHTWRVVAREARSQPWLVFCAAFVLLFSTGIGLATKNLGSLSRYRIPMMPMYACSLLALRARLRIPAAVRPAKRVGPSRREARRSPAAAAEAEALRVERVARLRRRPRPGSL